MFQVWVDWSLCMTVPYQAGSSWSQKSEQATRAAELHVWQGHMTSDEAQQAQDVGYVSRKLTSCNCLFDSGASHSFITSSFVAKT
jgi:hypothetical protein